MEKDNLFLHFLLKVFFIQSMIFWAYQKTFNTISFQHPLGGPHLQRNPAQPIQIPPHRKSTYLPEFLASMVWEFVLFCLKKGPQGKLFTV